jgi:hypothetical protein
MSTTTRRKATRAVVALVFANLAVSVLFALLTLLLHDDILAYQQRHHPGADAAALARTLWTRPATVFCVALLYIRIVRQLLAGTPRALRRVRIISGLGLPAIGWLLFTAEYPAWLRAVQVIQLLVLALLAVTVNNRTVRSAFDAPVPPDLRPRNRKAAWTLILLAPVVAELSLGNLPLTQMWIFPIFVPIYGAGALLIREVVRRFGGGLPSLLLAGVAYGLIEEGLALQSLTSPHLYDAAGWAPRLLGVNSAYTELNLVYHPVFSVTIPIVLTELLFARHGEQPYLRRGGLIVTGAVAALGALLLRFSVPPTEDPGYTLPLLAAAVIVLAALLAAVAAFLVRRKPTRPPAAPPTPPSPPSVAVRTGAALSPASVAIWTGAAAFAFLALLFPFAGAQQSFFTHGAWALLPMTAAATIVTGTALALRHWTASPAWSPAHLFAACLGPLVAHTLFGLAGNAETLPDRLFLAALALVTVALGARALHRFPAGDTALDAVPRPAAGIQS